MINSSGLAKWTDYSDGEHVQELAEAIVPLQESVPAAEKASSTRHTKNSRGIEDRGQAPPNAIVFASGYVTIPQMSPAGLVLNLIAIFTITFLGTWLIPVVLVW